jgi:hypothetical protein
MNDAIAEGFSYGFGFGMDLELLIDMPHVGLDRVEADIKFRRRCRVVMAFASRLLASPLAVV